MTPSIRALSDIEMPCAIQSIRVLNPSLILSPFVTLHIIGRI